MDDQLSVGTTYVALNQGSGITPRNVEVTVVWLENDAVHYRKAGNAMIHQTPRSRFLDIVGL